MGFLNEGDEYGWYEECQTTVVRTDQTTDPVYWLDGLLN